MATLYSWANLPGRMTKTQALASRATSLGCTDRKQGLLPDGLDAYWRLDSYESVPNHALITELRKAGYVVRSAQMVKSTLTRLLQRIDRQLLCYDKCSFEELEEFVESRGLTVLPSNRIEQTRLIETLQQGDAEFTFDGLMELPAELRVRIYEYYVCDFPESLFKPTQPPLARICRQIHEEFLPVFYSIPKFVLQMHLTGPESTRLRWNTDTDHFIKSIHPTHLAMIRNIEIKIEVRPRRFTPPHKQRFIYKFCIQLGGPKHECSVELKRLVRLDVVRAESKRFFRWETEIESLEKDIHVTFEMARHRTQEKTPQLTLKDLLAARKKMEDWLKGKRKKGSAA